MCLWVKMGQTKKNIYTPLHTIGFQRSGVRCSTMFHRRSPLRAQRNSTAGSDLGGSEAVILVGLSKAPQLNGKTGTVAAGVDGATGGVHVPKDPSL